MPDTLSLWHAEHVNFARLLDLLERQLDSVHEEGSPDYELMLEIMYYMTHYPDVVHHPKEELVFALMREREPGLRAIIDRLGEQHASLRVRGHELVRDLDGVLDGSMVSREHIDATGRAYLAEFREHMQIEETQMLPRAAHLLRVSDWANVDAAVHQIEDPLFGSRMNERYVALARHIQRS